MWIYIDIPRVSVFLYPTFMLSVVMCLSLYILIWVMFAVGDYFSSVFIYPVFGHFVVILLYVYIKWAILCSVVTWFFVYGLNLYVRYICLNWQCSRDTRGSSTGFLVCTLFIFMCIFWLVFHVFFVFVVPF